jgi:serine/threonine-protein kinase RsbW
MSFPERSPGRTPVGHQPEEFALELPSDVSLIESAVAYLENRLRELEYDGPRLTLNFRVGITEALANAMIYGNDRDPARRVRVSVAANRSRVELLVADEGQGFDPDCVPDPTAPANRERSGGRGIYLLRQLMDEVEYNACGNTVRLVLHREGPVRSRASGE